MTWLHWSLDLPSVKWQQSCLPHSHRQNDASWQKKCQMSFSFFLVGASLPVSLHGRKEVQPVKRYKVTSSSPKSHSLWICSECAILKSKYSLKKISQIISIFHAWRYINELLPMTQHRGSMNCESAVGALWVLILDDTHHTRKAHLGGGGVMGKKEILLWIC